MQVSLWERNEVCSWLMTTTCVSGVFALLVEWAPLAQDVWDDQHNAKLPTSLTEMSPALVMR